MANEFLRLSCPYCGGTLAQDGELYKCADCGNRFEKKKTETDSEKIRSILDEMKAEQVANIRRRLWEETHKEYISSEEIRDAAQKILDILPEDRFAGFYKAAVADGYEELNRFLDGYDATQTDDLPLILDFSIKVMEQLNISSVKALAERGLTGDAKIDYYSKIEAEAEKIEAGIYNTDVPRTVFLAYSSKDMKKVNEVAAYLESQNFTCFVALRNLRHGKGAKENYQAEIMNAIANCKCVVFLSSENSRAMTCDAMRIEIPYLRKTYPDKPRIEFLIEDYGKGTMPVARTMLKDYFKNLEYCTTLEDLGMRVWDAESSENIDSAALSKQQEELLKKVQALEEKAANQTVSSSSGNDIAPLLERARMFLEDGEFPKADEFAEQVLNREPKNAEAYLVKLLAELKLKKEEDLASLSTPFANNINYQKVLKFAGEERKNQLQKYNQIIEDRIAEAAERKASEGSRNLQFELNDDEKSYTVSVGKCSDVDVVIPSFYKEKPVTCIGEKAFENCDALMSITIPDSVTSIGTSAFYGCTNLIQTENGVQYVNKWVIDCDTSLSSVSLRSDTVGIGNSAFYKCSKLTSITIPDGVTSIGEDAFNGCSSLTSITIPDSVTSIGEYAFHWCDSLTSITIPNSVTSIGNGVFSNCESLESISAFFGNSVYHIAGNCLIETENKILIAVFNNFVIPTDGSVTSIADSVFSGCSNLTSITIPDGVTSIGEYAFSGCSNLTSITIPNSVTSIGEFAFDDCSSLTSITIPNSVTSIGENAFNGCSSLTSIAIPDSVTSIGGGAFDGCSNLESISVSSGNSEYHSAGNCLIETASKTLIAGCKNSAIPIDGSVSSIGDSAFSGCSDLTSITIPEGVASIGNAAFFACSSLTSITIPDRVASIGKEAFSGCIGLTNITIPNSVTSIGNIAFSDCDSLTTFTIPDSVTSIGEYTFHGCSSLTSITIPDSVISIGERAFAWCGSLTSITIPEGVTSIGEDAFYNCSKLTSITFKGTKAQLNAISKGSCWNKNTGAYTIHCTDGDIQKN